MTLALNPSADFAAVVDGLATITLHRRGGDSENIAQALRREITTREAAASNGKYTASDVRFHFAVSAVEATPKIGDVIEDADGERYTILDVQLATLAKRYRCTTRNLAVVHGLDSTVAIERATYAKGAQGAIERTWTVWKRVRARVQPVESTVGVADGAMQTAARWKVFIAEDLDLDQRCRVKTNDGTTYNILGWSRAEDVGGLLEMEVS
jgi:head-tail adaptor